MSTKRSTEADSRYSPIRHQPRPKRFVDERKNDSDFDAARSPSPMVHGNFQELPADSEDDPTPLKDDPYSWEMSALNASKHSQLYSDGPLDFAAIDKEDDGYFKQGPKGPRHPVDLDDEAPSSSMMTRRPIKVNDMKGLWKFYDQRFKQCQQTACKLIAKAWVKAVEPNKQSTHPYTGSDAITPHWWPKPWGNTSWDKVRHKEPDHLYKRERVHLLNHILAMVVEPNHRQHPDIRKLGLNIKKLEECTNEALSGFYAESETHASKKRYLNELFRVARQQERYKHGELNDDIQVWVLDNYRIFDPRNPENAAGIFEQISEEPDLSQYSLSSPTKYFSNYLEASQGSVLSSPKEASITATPGKSSHILPHTMANMWTAQSLHSQSLVEDELQTHVPPITGSSQLQEVDPACAVKAAFPVDAMEDTAPVARANFDIPEQHQQIQHEPTRMTSGPVEKVSQHSISLATSLKPQVEDFGPGETLDTMQNERNMSVAAEENIPQPSRSTAGRSVRKETFYLYRSQAWFTSAFGVATKVHKSLTSLLIYIGVKEYDIPAGHRRVRWTNIRGDDLYDDYIEHEVGAIDALQTYLSETSGQSNTAAGNLQHLARNHPVSSASSTTLPPISTAGSGDITDQPTDGRVSLSRSRNDLELGANRECATLSLLLCMERRKHAVDLFPIPLSHIANDRQLFRKLQYTYHRQRGTLRPYWSLRTLHSIHFMKFVYGGGRYIDVRCHSDLCEHGKPCVCIPPSNLVRPDGSDYECSPIPAKLSPPIGTRLMMDFFTHPEAISLNSTLVLRQLPKRTCEEIQTELSDLTEAWGIYYMEGWDWAKIWWVLSICFFPPSLIFGVIWGILKRDIQGAFGVASWWMTGSTILIGIAGTCNWIV